MGLTTAIIVFSSLLVAFDAKIINKYDVNYPKHSLEDSETSQKPIVALENGDISNVLETEEIEEGTDFGPLVPVNKQHKDKSYHDKHGHHSHHEDNHGHHDSHHGHNHGHKDNHHGNQNVIHEHHGDHLDNKKVSKKKDVDTRKVWKKPSSEGLRSDSDPCKVQKCKRKHLCLVNAETGEAECIPKKRLFQKKRQMKKRGKDVFKKKKKQMKKHIYQKYGSKPERKTTDKKYLSSGMSQSEKGHKIKKLKNEAETFKSHYEEKKRHRLHHIHQHGHQMEPLEAVSKVSGSKTGVSVLQKSKPSQKFCSSKELSQMSGRLLDWFKVLQDQDNRDHDHVIQKRNSMKKELHEQGECICQAPVRYEFLMLDQDEDDSLSTSELDGLETNGYEHCMRPFVESCDHDHNGNLSNREWCCCFADVMPPCLAKMEKIPSGISLGKPSVLPGAMVPQCDTDGFYKPLQCHASTGYCWCVDRNGVQIPGTNTRGTVDCENLDSNNDQPTEINPTTD